MSFLVPTILSRPPPPAGFKDQPTTRRLTARCQQIHVRCRKAMKRSWRGRDPQVSSREAVDGAVQMLGCGETFAEKAKAPDPGKIAGAASPTRRGRRGFLLCVRHGRRLRCGRYHETWNETGLTWKLKSSEEPSKTKVALFAFGSSPGKTTIPSLTAPGRISDWTLG